MAGLFLNARIRDAEKAARKAHAAADKATQRAKEADVRLEKLRASKKPTEVKKAS